LKTLPHDEPLVIPDNATTASQAEFAITNPNARLSAHPDISFVLKACSICLMRTFPQFGPASRASDYSLTTSRRNILRHLPASRRPKGQARWQIHVTPAAMAADPVEPTNKEGCALGAISISVAVRRIRTETIRPHNNVRTIG